MITTSIDIDIRETIYSTPGRQYWQVIITTKKRGLCYSCVFAGDKPAIDHIKEVWKNDRRSFSPHYS